MYWYEYVSIDVAILFFYHLILHCVRVLINTTYLTQRPWLAFKTFCKRCRCTCWTCKFPLAKNFWIISLRFLDKKAFIIHIHVSSRNLFMKRNAKLTLPVVLGVISLLASSILVSPSFNLAVKAQGQNQSSSPEMSQQVQQKLDELAQKFRGLVNNSGANLSLP